MAPSCDAPALSAVKWLSYGWLQVQRHGLCLWKAKSVCDCLWTYFQSKCYILDFTCHVLCFLGVKIVYNYFPISHPCQTLKRGKLAFVSRLWLVDKCAPPLLGIVRIVSAAHIGGFMPSGSAMGRSHVREKLGPAQDLRMTGTPLCA